MSHTQPARVAAYRPAGSLQIDRPIDLTDVPAALPEPGPSIVDRAITALDEFGGDLYRGQADHLLDWWVHRDDLTAEQVQAVLANYPTALEKARRNREAKQVVAEPASRPRVWDYPCDTIPGEVMNVIGDSGARWTRDHVGADTWTADEYEPHNTMEMIAADGPVTEVTEKEASRG